MALIMAALVQGLVERHGFGHFKSTSGKPNQTIIDSVQELARALAAGL